MKNFIYLLACCASASYGANIHTSGKVQDGEAVVVCSDYQDARMYLEQLPEPLSLPGIAARIRELDCVVLKPDVKYTILKVTTIPHLYEVEVIGKFNMIDAHAVIHKIKD